MYPRIANPNTIYLMAKMSVHSTMRCESHSTRRVKQTSCVFTRATMNQLDHRVRPDSTTLTCARAIAQRCPSTPMSIAVTS